MDCSTPGFPVHHQLPEFTQLMSIESVMPSNHLILCRPLLLLPSIFPSVRVFVQMSQFFASGGQSIGVSASASVLSMNIQDWFPLGLTGLISLQSRDSQESSPTPQFKSINSSALSFLIYWVKQTILVVFGFLGFFGLCHVAYGILVPQAGIERRPPQWKCQVLTTGLPGNSLYCYN